MPRLQLIQSTCKHTLSFIRDGGNRGGQAATQSVCTNPHEHLVLFCPASWRGHHLIQALAVPKPSLFLTVASHQLVFLLLCGQQVWRGGSCFRLQFQAVPGLKVLTFCFAVFFDSCSEIQFHCQLQEKNSRENKLQHWTYTHEQKPSQTKTVRRKIHWKHSQKAAVLWHFAGLKRHSGLGSCWAWDPCCSLLWTKFMLKQS